MRRIRSLRKYKKFNLRHATRQWKKNIFFKKRKNIVRKSIQANSGAFKQSYKVGHAYTSIRAPENFSFIESTEDMCLFIQQLENCFTKRQKVYLNLRHIDFIDYSAITVLLSVVYEFKSNKIGFNGNFPKKAQARRLLDDSGFFVALFGEIGKKVNYTIGKRNQMFTQAYKKVIPELGLLLSYEVSNTIWGEKKIYKGLTRVLLELMQNTNNHADVTQRGSRRWWLSVNHSQAQRKVSFVFVDYGVGVFESLKNKPSKNKWSGWIEKISKIISPANHPDLMKMLMDGDLHMTVTGKPYRGKGLPGIKAVANKNQIRNLHIITNDVFAKPIDDLYLKTRIPFSGTFVYWEIDESNNYHKWTIASQ